MKIRSIENLTSQGINVLRQLHSNYEESSISSIRTTPSENCVAEYGETRAKYKLPV